MTSLQASTRGPTASCRCSSPRHALWIRPPRRFTRSQASRPTCSPLSGPWTSGAIYLDGGTLVRSFLDEHLVDELTVTIVNVILGAGAPLFAGVKERHRLRLVAANPYPSGLVQLSYVA